MFALYRQVTRIFGFLLSFILFKRKINGKESPTRYIEKKAIITKTRPNGKLLWIHGASVGESQSALVLVKKILGKTPDINILVTTGTLTSAQLMEKQLPSNAFHQFYPLDRPKWVRRFLNHWKPDTILWMESELWPNMLHEIKKDSIPAILVNARLSPKSFKIWQRFPKFAKKVLTTFDKILCQTDEYRKNFDDLGASNTVTTDNLKYSSAPLSYDLGNFKKLKNSTANRKIWLYASTHEGEEEIAHIIHKKLAKRIPNLLTIIVPRHPERRDNIKQKCASFNLNACYRGTKKELPSNDHDIYIADTLGELGLFYALSPIAVIGRSLSNDGGGGHNPIEAAQLDCAVIHGVNIQNLQQIYDEMDNDGAAIKVENSDQLYETIKNLFENELKLRQLKNKAMEFANKKTHVIDVVMKELSPILSVLSSANKKTDYAHKNS